MASLGVGAILVVAVTLGAACSKPAELGGSSPAEESLGWQPEGRIVVCDGAEREVGTVTGVEPGEEIEITTPLPVDVPGGTADDDGRWVLRWACDPEEASLRWNLTATGVDSGRRVTLLLVGSPDDPDAEPIMEVQLHDEAAVCHGRRTVIGVITGADPEERVRFESGQTANLRAGRADADGSLGITWSCTPAEGGEIWEVTAEGAESGRTADFTVVGSVPEIGDESIEVTYLESPVSCDGERRPLARLDGLLPAETVTFAPAGDASVGGDAPGDGDAPPSAEDATGGAIRPGTVDADGGLVVNWQCESRDASRRWEIVATGEASGKTATLVFSGAEPPGGLAAAAVELLEDPFACDGERRPVAVVSNLWLGEFVDFASPDAGPLREGRADGSEVTVHWQCEPADVDTAGEASRVWAVTATGRQSGRSVSFDITGIPP